MPNTKLDPALFETRDDWFWAIRETVGVGDPYAFLNSRGEQIPRHVINLRPGELVVVKDQTFRVKYVGETSVLLEPESGVIKTEADTP